MKKTMTLVTLTALFLFVWLAPVATVHAEGEEEVFSFELPVSGATGFASIRMPITVDPCSGKTLATLQPGACFTIKGEKENCFRVKYAGQFEDIWGYVEKKYTLINLPDIIPSIVYYDSNSVSSLFRSSGAQLPGITNQVLYNVNLYNERFGEKQFVMPVLYDFAKQIMVAQQAALAEGNSLKLYETYRPHDVQMNVSSTLSDLMNSNSDVSKGIASWGKGWFISTSYSNHQRGRAMDCSLVKIVNIDKCKLAGKYEYSVVTDYEEYSMPTQMHELSTAAVTFKYGVGRDAWKSAPLSSGMLASEGALLLQKYCTDAGLTPLASEWWHFDSPNCPNKCKGEFRITNCKSERP